MATWLSQVTGQLNDLVEDVLAVEGDIYEKRSDDEYYEQNKSIQGINNAMPDIEIFKEENNLLQQKNSSLIHRIEELEDLLKKTATRSKFDNFDSSDDDHGIVLKSEKEKQLEQAVKNLEEELNDSIQIADGERQEKTRLEQDLNRIKSQLEITKANEKVLKDTLQTTETLVKESSSQNAKLFEQLKECNNSRTSLDDFKTGDNIHYSTDAFRVQIQQLTERVKLSETQLNTKAEAIQKNSDRTIKNLQDRLSNSESKFAQLQAEIISKDETLTNLHDQLNTQQEQLAAFHHQVQKHKKDQEISEQQNSNLESTIEKLNTQLSKTSSELDTQRVLNQAQQKQCSENELLVQTCRLKFLACKLLR